VAAVAERDWQAILRLADLARRLRGRSAAAREGEAATARAAFDRAARALRREAGDPLVLKVYLPLVEAIAEGPLTLAQIGQSLDGRSATESGHSHFINGPGGLDHLHRLRALSDAVVVGAGTVAADDPRLTTRRVAGPSPVRVVLDPRRRLPRQRRVFDGTVPTLTLVADGDGRSLVHDPDALPVAPAPTGALPPAAILEALRRRGLNTVLIEGGSRTLSAFFAEGCIDRLHILVAPLLLGSGRPALALPVIERVEDGLRPQVAVHSLGTDTLFDCRFG
jgi:riboflavin-specific deaminase-like protein